VLDTLGIARLSVPGYEADDIIATLASQAVDAGLDVLIVTGPAGSQSSRLPGGSTCAGRSVCSPRGPQCG
jgi:hypothetical protein